MSLLLFFSASVLGGLVTLDTLPWHQEALAVRAAHGVEAKQAFAQLEALIGAPAALARARLNLQEGRLDAVAAELTTAAGDPILVELVALEQGRLALLQRRYGEAAALLSPLLAATMGAAVVAPLAESLLGQDPKALLAALPALRAHAVGTNARSALLLWEATALRRLGRKRQARAAALRRYLEEPLAAGAPQQPPEGTTPTAVQRLDRAERLLNAHRSEVALAELTAIPEAALRRDDRCRRQLAIGLANRKLHRYAEAATALGVAARCRDQELARRALYMQAKVLSIHAGLAAVPVIQRFAKRYVGHSMVDDVLFWAGDLYQRREQHELAAAFFNRAAELQGDHCAEARWRLAWSAYRQDRDDEALAHLASLDANPTCSAAAFDRARALYWSGRIAAKQSAPEAALAHFRGATAAEPLGYYAQLAWHRVHELDANATPPLAPSGTAVPPLCEGALVDAPAYRQGLSFLLRGLVQDAQNALLAVEANATAMTSECADAALWLALLLNEAGAKREASWRLRTALAPLLEQAPTAERIGIVRAAFPLAYRDDLALAENESGLPSFFLQALAREESAFDPAAVSWAGAYGLTQLLLETAQFAAKLFKPRLTIHGTGDLFDPKTNARLGGAMLGSLLKRYRHPALGLAAYNAGENYARTLWQRHSGGDFDRMAEDIGIKETRGYVMRVLQTFGIYRWLYAETPLLLPAELTLPEKP